MCLVGVLLALMAVQGQVAPQPAAAAGPADIACPRHGSNLGSGNLTYPRHGTGMGDLRLAESLSPLTSSPNKVVGVGDLRASESGSASLRVPATMSDLRRAETP